MVLLDCGVFLDREGCVFIISPPGDLTNESNTHTNPPVYEEAAYTIIPSYSLGFSLLKNSLEMYQCMVAFVVDWISSMDRETLI